VKRREKALRKFFPFDRGDTDRRVLSYASPDDGQDRSTGVAGKGWRRGGRETKIERRGDIGHAGKVNRLMVLRSRDVYELLLRLRLGNGVVIGDDGSSQGDRRKTPGKNVEAEDADEGRAWEGTSQASHPQWNLSSNIDDN
jgi:hypothetical protein